MPLPAAQDSANPQALHWDRLHRLKQEACRRWLPVPTSAAGVKADTLPAGETPAARASQAGRIRQPFPTGSACQCIVPARKTQSSSACGCHWSGGQGQAERNRPAGGPGLAARLLTLATSGHVDRPANQARQAVNAPARGAGAGWRARWMQARRASSAATLRAQGWERPILPAPNQVGGASGMHRRGALVEGVTGEGEGQSRDGMGLLDAVESSVDWGQGRLGEIGSSNA